MSLRRPIAIALVSSVALAGLVTVTATGASGAPTTNVKPRAAVSNTTTWAAIKTVSLGYNFVTVNQGADIAVNSADDTVYVVSTLANRFLVINGKTGTLTDDSFSLVQPSAVAVDQNDDTIYTVTKTGTPANASVQSWSASPVTRRTDDSIANAFNLAVDSADDTVYVSRPVGANLSYFSGRTPSVVSSRGVGAPVSGIAVDQSDDSVWMTHTVDDSLGVWNGTTNVLGAFIGGVGSQPYAVAVDDTDDTVYVADALSPYNIAVINGRTSVVGTPIAVPTGLWLTSSRALAIDDSNNRLFAVGWASVAFGVINEANADDSVYLSAPASAGTPINPSLTVSYEAVAVDEAGSNRGLVWAAAPGQARVQALAQVSPSLFGSTTGAAGDTVTISVTSTPTVAFDFDDIAVTGVRFNGVTPGTNLAAGTGNTWSVRLPGGLPAGPVSVEVLFNGGQYALAGTYTVQSSTPPTPTPVYPPGAPTDVKAVAGSGEATVSWTAPAYVGSYPITDYQVTSSTGSHTCLTKSTSCTLTGLTGGTSYTFTVRALNGAGWGAYSTPSNAVTPVAKTILITGSRDTSDTRYVKVQGTTTDLVGKQVTPYVRFPGQTGYTAGVGVQTVAADGTFTWQRKTGKKTYVYFVHGDVQSNTVTIRAR